MFLFFTQPLFQKYIFKFNNHQFQTLPFATINIFKANASVLHLVYFYLPL